MRKYIYLILSLLFITVNGIAQVQVVNVTNASLNVKDDVAFVNIPIDLRDVNVRSNWALVITPFIESQDGSKQIDFESIAIYGRSRYYYYLRNNGSDMITGNEVTYRTKNYPDIINYQKSKIVESWAREGRLMLKLQTYGCCGEVLWDDVKQLDSMPPVFIPEFAFITPEVEKVKSRSLSGRAYIDFIVNKIDIDANYMNNRYELGKIYATIDSVKNDKDITVKHISIKGYASPEGSYELNEKLAKERTIALKEYVSKLYNFPNDFISTAYESEDWEGFRTWLEASDLKEKSGIFKILEMDLGPDAMLWKIKSTYPEQYNIILNDCFPLLRHSDYVINYDIKHFTDINKIRKLARKHPQKLSLEEFYLAAQAVEEGSEEYNNIFETAVIMYPDSEVANINAAQVAMQKGDMKGAEKYLKNAGDSKEALYARALYQAINNNYKLAKELFHKSAEMGLVKAHDMEVAMDDYITKFLNK